MCVIFSRRPRCGFTLLELMIAIVLLGVLATALYGSFFTVVRARDRASAGMEERRELGATMDLLRKELSSILYHRMDTRLRLIVEDRDRFGRPSSGLEFAVLQPPSQGRPASGVSLVRYRLDDRAGILVLTRSERDMLYESPPVAYPQMERISSFLVECFDGSKWVRSWDTNLNGTLPRQIRITVQVEEEGRLQAFSVRAVPRMAEL